MRNSIFLCSVAVLWNKANCESTCGDAPSAENGKWDCNGNKCTLKCEPGFGWKRPGTGPSGKKVKCQSGKWTPIDDNPWPACTSICPALDESKYLPGGASSHISCNTLGGEVCTPGESCGDGNECYINCDREDFELLPTPNSNTLKCQCNGARCKWTGHGRDVAEKSSCVPKQDKRIIGGTDGVRGRDGYTLSIGYYAFNRTSNRREWVHFCGGVLVTSNWAVTAAHCRQARLRAIIGDYRLNRRDGSEVPCRIVNQLRHPDYDSRTKNDIMMISLRCKKLTMGTYIQPAILPRIGTEPRPGTQCRICGWGNTHYPVYVPATTLQCVTLPIIDTDLCNGPQHYVGSIHDKIMCIGNLGVGGQDSCQGDSGGPANCNGVIYGIVMGGLYCAKANYPGVYTKTAPYIPWFRGVISSAARSRGTRGRRSGRGRR